MMRPQLPRTPPREAKRNPTLGSKFSTSPPRRSFTTLVKSVKDVVSKANLSGHFSKRDSILTIKDIRRRKPGFHHSLRYIRSSRLASSRSSIILQRGVDRIMLGERVRYRPTSEAGSPSNALPTLGSLGLLHFFPLLSQPDPSATDSGHLTSVEVTSKVGVSPSLEAQGPSSGDERALPMFLPGTPPRSATALRDHDPKCSVQGSQNSRSFYSIDTMSSGSYYDDTFAETLDNVFDISWDSADALHDDPGMGSGSRNPFVLAQVDGGNQLTRRYDQNISSIPEAEVNSLAGVRPLDRDTNRGPSSFSARGEPTSFVSLLNEVHSSRPKTIIEESEGESSPCTSSVPSQISSAAAEPLTCPTSPSGLLVPSSPFTVLPCGMLLKPHECHDLTRAEMDHSRGDVDLKPDHDSLMNLEHGAEPTISEPSPDLNLNLPFQALPQVPTTLSDAEDVPDSQISHVLDAHSLPIQIPKEIRSKFDFKGDQELPLLPIDDHNRGQREIIASGERTIDIDAANPRKGFHPPPPVPARSLVRPSAASPFFKSTRSVSFAGPPSLPRDEGPITSSAGPKISFVTLFKNLRRPKSTDVSDIDNNVKKPNKIKPVLTPIHIEHPTEASVYSIIQEYDEDPFAMNPPLKSRTVHTRPSLAVRSDSLISLPYLPLDPMPHKNFHLPTRLTESTLRLHTTLSAAFAHSDSSSFSGTTNTNATLIGSSPICPPSSATTVFSRFTGSGGGPRSTTGWPASSPQSPIIGGNVDNDSHPTLIFSQANASEPILSLSPPLYDIALGSGSREDGDERRGARVLHTASIGLGDPCSVARHSGNRDVSAAQVRATRRKMSMLEIGYNTLDLSALP
ncbi:hypothetical protein BS47DRAFT_1344326 [Hydnum rufescens UP504]|uniref:Uncharacterized protein n=1 Tax=Hydnum rufescens UP504 TaxID=1448309 RepID=A0A9P6AWR0_9AGAM|nr:hypothetical protein BS47DRAFT_1344326 [Hydnum rufescens UP504]